MKLNKMKRNETSLKARRRQKRLTKDDDKKRQHPISQVRADICVPIYTHAKCVGVRVQVKVEVEPKDWSVLGKRNNGYRSTVSEKISK